jgi:hypothetical protein
MNLSSRIGEANHTVISWDEIETTDGRISTMAAHILVVLSMPTPGQDEEYNRWYSEEHLDDVLRVPGFVAAQRFKLCADGPKGLPAQYLAVYEMDTDAPAAAFAALGEATQAGRMQISSALDTENVVAGVFTPITERKVRRL